MQAFIDKLFFISRQPAQTPVQCNYRDNYYGDQVCITTSAMPKPAVKRCR
ncbi:hypothetical protein [Bowmanella sp. JS7-9]|nr:hypothetical protein [Bowmanella sp. JS7-9]